MIARILPFIALLILVITVAAQRADTNPHGKLAFDCETCHTTGSWQQLKSPLPFSHDKTGFPLKGAHRQANCNGCHRNLVFSQVSVACADCHQDVHAGRLGTDCQSCHMLDSWSNRKDQIATHADRGFPLTGVHAISDCAACHTTETYDDFKAVAITCRGCHEQAYLTADNPDHKLAGFAGDCEQCHHAAAGSWQRTTYQHTSVFPLTNGHQKAECVACHATQFAATSGDCYSCHQPDYTQAQDPNHQQGGFPTNCTMCHTTVAWTPASFDHATSSFPLTGAHIGVQCVSCHSSGYVGTPTDCYSCHQNDFASTDSPNHVQSQFPHTCTSCHTTTSWSPSTFDHNGTGFTLTGAHTSVSCVSCHSSGYAGTPTACYSCHQSDYAGTTDPNHALAGFSTTCTQCHTTASWGSASYDHAGTGFPLTGAHVTVQCSSCHASVYAGTSTDCNSCHNADYVATTNPNHAQLGFPTTCVTCHTTAAWSPASFDHTSTGFTLTGKHTTAACLDCHSSGYAGTPADCYSCHQSDFTGATDPNHTLAGFAVTCGDCHTTAGWSPSSFNHSTTGFTLTGAHVGATCIACHSTAYAGTSSDCYACHQSDYTSAADPNHVLGNYPHTCTSCHTTTAWVPASFDHNTTSFPLTGAHLSAACLACHSSGYTGTPTACYACHQSDYAGTTDPVHTAANFPTTCQSCHTTSAWQPSTWDHDAQYFPIYSGKHSGVWNQCSDCHVSAANYAVFECINCHEHNRTDTDGHHTEVSGYQYLSTACYTCHPRGTH